jgi:hypothetical protein
MSYLRKKHFSDSLRGLLELFDASNITTDCYDLSLRRVEVYSQSFSHMDVAMQFREQKYTVISLLIWFYFDLSTNQVAPHV